MRLAMLVLLVACGRSAAPTPEEDDTPAFVPTAFAVDVHGHGRPIILIPGLGCPGAVWDDTVAHLAGYESHVLTLAGFAGQAAIDQPLAATTRDELVHYIRDRKLDHPIIVGHSMGGFIAYWIAASEPDLVGPTIVIDSGAALGGDDAETNAASAKQARDLWANASDDQFAAEVKEAYTSMATDPAKIATTIEAVGRSDRRAIGDAIAEMFTTDLRPQLSKIRAPVLLVLADGSLQDQFRAQAATVADHTVFVVPHARHFVFVDDPLTFFATIDGFLAAHPAAG